MSSPTWRRVTVLLALAASAFAFNTTENLPIGLLPLMSADLAVPLPWVGYLVTGYGLTVAVVSLPLAQVTRNLPRRYTLTGVLAVLVLSTLVAVVAVDYRVLLAARVATALAQALFWAVTAPVAVGLFAPRVRGRVVAVMSVGGSLATVLGVPAGTWLGQQAGWRAPFLALAALAVAALVVVAGLLPTSRPEESHGAYGSAPHTGRFVVTLLVTAVSMTGMFAGFTYLVRLLTGVTGFADETVGPLLFVFGLAGIAGVGLAGHLLDRFPYATLVVPVGVQAVALLGLGGFATGQVVVVGLLALLGCSAAPVFLVTQGRMLQVAPGRTELAFAANSAAFNVGVALGALLGGVLLAPLGVRGAFTVGGLLTVVALLVVLAEPLLTGRTRPRSTGRSTGRSPGRPSGPAVTVPDGTA
ncbi:MFS transporter [Micromonospora cathayae]|uniref:MFS transporter n=1 Tax=Micromonospora cathayae TaxID=3028804 RepID=A0ABY8A0Y1_9ACTN|nr:MFS transporter [Micromonospora sp. HUAS 3]WDZ87779.1 MFS transporter [Micromonospora sp. HUAS 3]